ncbi:MAG: carboxypeptidase-like regulatory domain-containing protein [Bacteroidales bacterium]|nr:carboxypeptidase-like regulatory domain-containing protein [Bacteroidales bacterium]
MNLKTLLLALAATAAAITAHAGADTLATVSGRVIDAQSRQPIPYAQLRIVGSNVGTQANIDGEYSLKIPRALEPASIAVGCAGYRTDTLSQRALRRQHSVRLKPLEVTLHEVEVCEFMRPSALLKEVVRRIPDNYWCDTAIGTFFFRRYGLTSDSLYLFCEAIADIMRPGYDKQYHRKSGLIVVEMGNYDSIALAGNYKRYPLSRLLVYDTAMLRRMLGDTNYLRNPFAGRSQTVYDDRSAFFDILQDTRGSYWLSDKRGRVIDRRSKLTTYDDASGETYYLITYVTDRDSASILINHRDKALLHFYHTSLRPDTLMLPYPLNRFINGIISPYNRTHYEYAKIDGRYTLVFAMHASAYKILSPKKSIVGGKINREIRNILTDDVIEDCKLWSLIDMRHGDSMFIDSALVYSRETDLYYHDVLGHGSADDAFWQNYNTIPVESRIAEKLRRKLATR